MGDRCKNWRDKNPERLREQRELEHERRRLKRAGIEYCNYPPVKRLTIEERRVRTLVRSVRDRARKNNIPYKITRSELTIPTHCKYLGVELDYTGKQGKYMASIDRITPELGYVDGNIQIISLLANQMKSNASIDELITFSQRVLITYGEKVMNMSK